MLIVANILTGIVAMAVGFLLIRFIAAEDHVRKKSLALYLCYCFVGAGLLQVIAIFDPKNHAWAQSFFIVVLCVFAALAFVTIARPREGS